MDLPIPSLFIYPQGESQATTIALLLPRITEYEVQCASLYGLHWPRKLTAQTSTGVALRFQVVVLSGCRTTVWVNGLRTMVVLRRLSQRGQWRSQSIWKDQSHLDM